MTSRSNTCRHTLHIFKLSYTQNTLTAPSLSEELFVSARIQYTSWNISDCWYYGSVIDITVNHIIYIYVTIKHEWNIYIYTLYMLDELNINQTLHRIVYHANSATSWTFEKDWTYRIFAV